MSTLAGWLLHIAGLLVLAGFTGAAAAYMGNDGRWRWWHEALVWGAIVAASIGAMLLSGGPA